MNIWFPLGLALQQESSYVLQQVARRGACSCVCVRLGEIAVPACSPVSAREGPGPRPSPPYPGPILPYIPAAFPSLTKAAWPATLSSIGKSKIYFCKQKKLVILSLDSSLLLQ